MQNKGVKVARHAKHGAEITIQLGYEMPTGDEVKVPLRHMAVTGQTQRSGKTTTLEALISRASITALAFITKRGEGSFGNAPQTPVYFEDSAGGRPYWEFVESIVASTMGQKMKFERAWIVKAAKGAKTLEDVRGNLEKLQHRSTRSMDQDIYMLLAEYLDIVLPQMREHQFAKALILHAGGLNVMDLTPFSEEMQMLIVRSCLLWVHKYAHNVVTIVPEAWKFVPEGRMTPVKPAAEKLVREGAGLGNFVWIDSQDIAGVSKLLLRSVTVWIIGVQREANEIKRTLANIPEGIAKPKAAAVATLGIGEFFACFDEHIHRTYVQPAWLSDGEAYAVATGMKKVDELKTLNWHTQTHATYKSEEESEMTKDEEAELRQEISRLTKVNQQLQQQLEQHHPKHERADNPLGVRKASIDDLDTIYQMVKKRLAADAPSLLKVVTFKPELEVTVSRQTVEADGSTLRGRLAMLIAEGFFDTPATGNSAYSHFQKVAFPTAKPNVYRELDKLATMGFLTKEDAGYQAVKGMKVNIVEV